MALSLAASSVVAPQARKAVAGRAVASKARVSVRGNRAIVVRATADKREQLLASATVAAASLMAVVPAADAAVSPSLKNLLLSVAAGATVVGAIVVAISGVAQFDQIARK